MGRYQDRWENYEPPSYIVRENWPVPGDWKASKQESKLFRLYWRMVELCDPVARRLNHEDSQPLELSQSFFDFKHFAAWFMGKYGIDAIIAVDNPGWTTWMLNCTRFSRFKGTFSPSQTKLFSGWALSALGPKPKVPAVHWKSARKKSRVRPRLHDPIKDASGFYARWKHMGRDCFTGFHEDEDTVLAEFFDVRLNQFDEITDGEFDPEVIERLQKRRKMWEHLRNDTLGG